MTKKKIEKINKPKILKKNFNQPLARFLKKKVKKRKNTNNQH